MTCIVHTGASWIIVQIVRKRSNVPARHRLYHAMLSLNFIVLLMIVATLFESMIWALGYLAVEVFSHFEEALYFSIVTFTTLGYGDITLDQNWRLLASFEAANGIIMFGWSTGMVIAVIHHLYLQWTPNVDEPH